MQCNYAESSQKLFSFYHNSLKIFRKLYLHIYILNKVFQNFTKSIKYILLH